MPGYVCDLHVCGEYGQIIEQESGPEWPRCPGCTLPLYLLPEDVPLSAAVLTEFRARCRVLAAERGWGIVELSRAAHVGQNAFYRTQEGVTLNRALMIARNLGVDPRVLVDYVPGMQEHAAMRLDD